MSVEQAHAGPTQTADQRSIWVIFSGLMLALLIASLDQTVVATALPTIVSDLGGLSQLSWVVTGYLLASTVSTPLWGKLGDMYGRKRFFQAAIVIFLIGSALSGFADSMIELIAFRAGQGRRGGPDSRRADHGRGRRPAPGARSLPGILRRYLRGRQRARAADRRLLRGQPVLAGGLLHQPPYPRRRPRGELRRAG